MRLNKSVFGGGQFGDEYVERNREGLSSKVALFSKVLSHVSGRIVSALEFGSNIGLNLKALKVLQPDIELTAVEINEKAALECASIPYVSVVNDSIFNFHSQEKFDLTFTCGVLIHINPDRLNEVYDMLYEYSKRYILIAEYYNPIPVEVAYRGNMGKLFKRDFAGELMDKFSDVRLVDYGFVYHRDNMFPADDATWFLLKKK